MILLTFPLQANGNSHLTVRVRVALVAMHELTVTLSLWINSSLERKHDPYRASFDFYSVKIFVATIITLAALGDGGGVIISTESILLMLLVSPTTFLSSELSTFSNLSMWLWISESWGSKGYKVLRSHQRAENDE